MDGVSSGKVTSRCLRSNVIGIQGEEEQVGARQGWNYVQPVPAKEPALPRGCSQTVLLAWQVWKEVLDPGP